MSRVVFIIFVLALGPVSEFFVLHLFVFFTRYMQMADPEHSYILYQKAGDRLFAKHGARNIENGGPVFRLRSRLLEHLRKLPKKDLPRASVTVQHKSSPPITDGNPSTVIASGKSVMIEIIACYTTCSQTKDEDTCDATYSVGGRKVTQAVPPCRILFEGNL